MNNIFTAQQFAKQETHARENKIPLLRKIIKQKRKIRKTNNKHNSKNKIRKNLYNEIKLQSHIDNIVNLGNFQLTNSQTAVLNKGLGFVQTPKQIQLETILHALSDFERRMLIQYYFATHPSKQKLEPFRPKSTWIPPDSECKDIEKFLQEVQDDLITLHNNARGNPENLTQVEIKAISELRANKNMIIKRADKGGRIVLWPREMYLAEAEKQLVDKQYYLNTTEDHTPEVAFEIETFLTFLYTKKLITEQCYEFLQPQNIVRTPVFYLLPKIHKPGTPGRPIISGCNSPTESLSKYLNHYLKPITETSPSYLKDTTHFLKVIHGLEQMPKNTILATLDVKSLYTNIPHQEGMQYCLEAIENHYKPKTPLPLIHIHQMLKFILENNYFTFDNKFYLQVHGTAMGTPFAPNYANIFMAKIENQILNNEQQIYKTPLLWKRFIDDIFIIWPHSENELLQFLKCINTMHPTIKFEMEYSHSKVNFLDTTVFVNKVQKLESSLYVKPTDICSLLHKQSFHPETRKQSVIYSQALRYRRIITNNETLETKLEQLKINLIKRGYSIQEINQQFQKVKQLSQTDALFGNSKRKKQGRILPFIIPFDKNTSQINKILIKHWKTIHGNKTLDQIWPNQPFLALQRNKNIGDILIHTDLKRE